ncbi:MAG: GMC family oxidoreductase N-terminal domain-containing protein [Pseudonocardiales bacterium]|nr:GMC family oxidoreductase N-terminal domain-containing protein [Pseudonocardiales bacterium]
MIVRLSSPVENIKDHYEVVVVGSGYGGAITASRLARAGRQVCLLERGKELQPGEYPDTGPEALAEIQLDCPDWHCGSRTGLYDFRVNEELNVFLGCGLGGTSLVNANVSLRADQRVFDDPRWPEALRADLGTLLEDGYQRAEEMLKPTPLPDSVVSLPKLQALADSSKVLPGRFYRPPINVTFTDHVNHVGVAQQACTLCGDCVSGCNYAAKNTVLMNYLPDARNHGAEIFTRVAVRFVERRESRWLVHYQVLDTGRELFDAPPLCVSAEIVVLAAGTLGSTEILLRSAAKGLPLSDRLGARLTGNGDVIAFSYNGDHEVNGVGWGHHTSGEIEPVGPCITGVIDDRDQLDLEQGMVIEEGDIPGALAGELPLAFDAVARATGINTAPGLQHRIQQHAREYDSLVFGAYRGAVRNTQTYLVMSHDDGNGQAVLEEDRLRLHWPHVGDQGVFERISKALQRATDPLRGTYLTSPIWTKFLGDRLISVHPLGGCVMAEDAEHGVVNHQGQVFAGTAGNAVHEGLYVSDGSVIPRPLGVNPLLTISALAERCCALLARDKGWTINYTLPSVPPAPPPPQTLGIQFSETMTGYLSTQVTDDYRAAADRGRADGSPCSFTLTIVSDDLERMLTDPNHQAHMIGTVTAPALSPDPITVTDGVFHFLVVDPDRVDGRQMRYQMKLTTDDDRYYYFVGFKIIHDDRGGNVLSDTTTLYITVHEGDNDTGSVVAKGILTIRPEDLAKQLTTIEARGATSAQQRLAAIARFGELFAGTLFDVYGGVLRPLHRFDVAAPARKKRPLRAGIPEVHPFTTADGVALRLTRYWDGPTNSPKGPVILAHGMGVSSRIFSTDTIETNLLEFLHAHGYDVWLLDFRASIELPASAERFTADDIARYDYPAALATVREVTASPSVQMVVHCFGSTAFFMAMLAGLDGVRSVVASQVATHLVCPPMTRLKSGLHLPALLETLGVESLTAYTDTHADWFNRLYDRFLEVFPEDKEEECTSAVCHRITFMYSLLYEHHQLGSSTHDGLHEMFGIADMHAMEHLALMVRAGALRSADGQDIYLPYLERLAIPITFIHGAENACFLPESTAKTMELLAQHNGAHLYRRHVIPGYGHIDCIFGKRAVVDVYPLILEHLETNR